MRPVPATGRRIIGRKRGRRIKYRRGAGGCGALSGNHGTLGRFARRCPHVYCPFVVRRPRLRTAKYKRTEIVSILKRHM